MQFSCFYRTVRKIVDVSDNYFMGTEYLVCPRCFKKLAAWSLPLLDQMPIERRRQFPALLSYKLGVDRNVILTMRERTQGNGVNQCARRLEDAHGTAHMAKVARYVFVFFLMLSSSLIINISIYLYFHCN